MCCEAPQHHHHQPFCVVGGGGGDGGGGGGGDETYYSPVDSDDVLVSSSHLKQTRAHTVTASFYLPAHTKKPYKGVRTSETLV